ncbi:hypothetical protein TSOC_004773, partial [Tetrabaena socialis]
MPPLTRSPPPPAVTLDAADNPQVSFKVALPAMTAAAYPGGASILVADHRSIIAQAASLPSTEYVKSSINSGNVARRRRTLLQSAGGVTLDTTVWFPANWGSLAGTFPNQTSLDALVFNLRYLPRLALELDSYPNFNATGATVSGLACTVSTPSLDSSEDSGGDSSGSSPGAAAAPTIVQVTLASNTSTVTSTFDIAKLSASNKDPPIISIDGDTILDFPASTTDAFSEAPLTVYDTVDAYNVALQRTYRLCKLPRGGRTALAIGPGAGDVDVTGFQCFGASSSRADSVDRRRPNKNGEAFLIEYRAYNSRNISATPKRRVVFITDACADSGESYCFTLGRCSVGNQCLNVTRSSIGSSSGSSGGSSSNRAVLAVPTDTTPPKLALLGAGRAAISPSGEPLMIDEVLYGSDWSDPGAIASDVNEFGRSVDITGRIQAFGVAAVNTLSATPPADLYGYLVRYQVSDAAGLVAPDAWRLVKVVCKATEAYCVDQDGNRGCSVNGVCGLGDSTGLFGDSSSGNTTTTSDTTTTTTTTTANTATTTTTDTTMDPSALEEWEPSSDALAPRIALNGDRRVEINQLANFDRCAKVADFRADCDKGVRSVDPKEGNLERQVLVCGQPFLPPAGQAQVPLLLGCNISNLLAGEYNITYSVTNSAGRTASTWRQLVIASVCPAGERLCADKVTCANYANDLGCDSALDTISGSTQAADDVPPAITLITTDEVPQTLRIKRGFSYVLCNGTMPTPDSPCELGATALDPDGQPGAQNLTGAIIACPPTACISATGCTATELKSYMLSQRGLAGCGLDPLAPVGTDYVIDLWVWDAGRKANATTRRSVSIVEPCPATNGVTYEFCTDPSGTALDTISGSTQAADDVPPAITLITTDEVPQTLRIKRGFSYVLCNGTMPTPDSPCELGATALDPDGQPGAQNLTGAIIACPPTACISATGCTATELKSYMLSQRGLAGCGLDPLAPVGTDYVIDLWVWDAGRKANATTRRSVSIVEPCPATNGVTYEFCTDPSGTFFCSPVPCVQANALQPPVSYAPALAVLPDVSYVEYGKVPPMYLGPCTSLNDTAACSAWAFGLTVFSDGRRLVSDLTAAISVMAQVSCTQQGDSQQCTTCTLDALHTVLGCPPGTYTFRFAVENDVGVATTDRTVHVFYKSSTRGSFTPGAPSANASQVAEAAASLNASVVLLAAAPSVFALPALLENNVSSSYTDAMSYAVDRLSTLGLDSSDVQLLRASVVPAAGDTFALLVAAEVFTYLPSAVHHGPAREFAAYAALLSGNATFRAEQLLLTIGYNASSGSVVLPGDGDVSSRRRRLAIGRQADGSLGAAKPTGRNAAALVAGLVYDGTCSDGGSCTSAAELYGGEAPQPPPLDGGSTAAVEALVVELLGGAASPAGAALLRRRALLLPQVRAEDVAAALHLRPSTSGDAAQKPGGAGNGGRRLRDTTSSSVGSSLGAVGGVQTTDYTATSTPDAATAYASALAALVSAMSAQVSALLADATVLSARVNSSLGDGPMGVEDRQTADTIAAYTTLEDAWNAAETSTLA